jgi:hypothetical protein
MNLALLHGGAGDLQTHVRALMLAGFCVGGELKAYTKSMTGKKHFTLSTSPMGETICSASEVESLEKEILEPTTKPLKWSTQCY